MFKQYLSSAGDIQFFAITGLIIFLSFFVGAVIWAITRKEDYLSKMKNLPLEDGEKIKEKVEL